LSRCSSASGCSAPLLTPCSASRSSLLMRQTQTLGDSLARRTWGSDSPRERVSLPSHPVAALARAAVAVDPAARALFAYGDGQASPRSQPRTPPALLKGRAVCTMPLPTAAGRCTGGKTKRRLPNASADGRLLCRAGPTEAIAYQQVTEGAGNGHTARLRDAITRPVALCAWAGPA